MAPVQKRLTMSLADSTSSSGTGVRPASSAILMWNRPRMVELSTAASFTIFA